MTANNLAFIEQRDRWPLWRRWLRWPDDATVVRRKAWEKLHEQLALHTRKAPESISLPHQGLGIFDTSRAHLQLLELRPSKSHSFASRDNPLGLPRRPPWPTTGPLTISAKVDDFRCSIVDIEGIGASKSWELYFPDVHSFGQSFRNWKGFMLDESGLNAALGHPEIRVIHSPGYDTLSLCFWDGRLFLDNAGGSHHFAAAAYLARELGIHVPLQAQLWLYWLNEPVWRELLDKFRILLAPVRGIWPVIWIADICGECHELKLPGAIAEGIFVFVPRQSLAVNAIAKLLEQAAIVEVTAWWSQVLAQQNESSVRLKHRWPELPGLAGAWPSSDTSGNPSS